MNITPIYSIDPSKAEIEQVQQEKQEYHLIGSYLRTRGLRLYTYNPREDEIQEIKPEAKTTLTIGVDPKTGQLAINDRESKEKCMIDSRNIPFEALNLKNAEKRVRKYKNGEIGELCNLTSSDKSTKITQKL